MAVFKCLVLGCSNQSDQGLMVGKLCAPCDIMLRTGKPGTGGGWVGALARERDDLHTALSTIVRTANGVRKIAR